MASAVRSAGALRRLSALCAPSRPLGVVAAAPATATTAAAVAPGGASAGGSASHAAILAVGAAVAGAAGVAAASEDTRTVALDATDKVSTVSVASGSSVKLAAVQDAYVLSASAVSPVPSGGAFPAAEQPLGEETEELCAKRLAHLMASTAVGGGDRLVAIESGLYHLDGAPQEVAVVKVHSRADGRTFTGFAGVSLDPATPVGHSGATLADLLARVTPEKTLGALIAEADPSIPANDWVGQLAGETRGAQIARAVRMAEAKRVLYHAMGLYQDFPKPPVLFQDVGDIYVNPRLLNAMVDLMANDVAVKFPTANKLIMLEARGFPVAAALQQRLRVLGQDASLVQARKPKKLPGHLLSQTYSKEYGTDTLALQEHMLQKGDRVLLVDDIIATGGTLRACEDLLERVNSDRAPDARVRLLASVVINQVDFLVPSWKVATKPYVALQ